MFVVVQRKSFVSISPVNSNRSKQLNLQEFKASMLQIYNKRPGTRKFAGSRPDKVLHIERITGFSGKTIYCLYGMKKI
jgi:hypothetical protein